MECQIASSSDQMSKKTKTANIKKEIPGAGTASRTAIPSPSVLRAEIKSRARRVTYLQQGPEKRKAGVSVGVRLAVDCVREGEREDVLAAPLPSSATVLLLLWALWRSEPPSSLFYTFIQEALRAGNKTTHTLTHSHALPHSETDRSPSPQTKQKKRKRRRACLQGLLVRPHISLFLKLSAPPTASDFYP